MKYILSIDIGGTRIKSAVLPERPSIEQVMNAPSRVVPTLGWLNHSLPKLVDPNHWPSLAAYYKKQGIHYDTVALSVPGVVDEHGRFMRADLVDGPAKVPLELLKALNESAGCKVTLIKDADAWMMGFQAVAEMCEIEVRYPAVLMAFGTGFGISAAFSVDSVASIEVSARPIDTWKSLVAVSGCDEPISWLVHKIIGRPFFEYVDKSKKDWDYLKIRDEYTKRVNAALDDILPWIERCMGNPIRTCILAGGNAGYVSKRALSDRGINVFGLTAGMRKIPLDLINVLGVEASSRRPTPMALQ